MFIEPLFAVALNNRLTLANKEVEAEEQRLLAWLTGLVSQELPELEHLFDTLTEVDVLHAKVALARKQGGTKPRFGGTAFRLTKARHPLLLASGQAVVPVDLHIPQDKLGLIISGPNTGGKTAALKTLGLLCLMAHSGLLIPVEEESQLPFLRGVFSSLWRTAFRRFLPISKTCRTSSAMRFHPPSLCLTNRAAGPTRLRAAPWPAVCSVT